MNSYEVYGLHILSEIPLMDIPCGHKQQSDVSISLQKLPPLPTTQTLGGTHYKWIGDEILLGWPEIGQFLIAEGQSIGVCQGQYSSSPLIGKALLGLPMAILLQQRGDFVLHGSSVVIKKRAVTFIGNKGMGKSTLAAFFLENGYEILTDDVAAIQISKNRIRHRPGYSHMKLWPDVIQELGHDPEFFPQITPELEKRSVPFGHKFYNDFIEPGAIFVLAMGKQTNIEKLDFQKAVLALNRNMMGCLFTKNIPRNVQTALFRKCTTIASNIPVYQLSRPHNFSVLPDTMDQVIHAVS